MEPALSELLARWPVPVVAGALFYVLWVPIVLVASALTYGKNRWRLMPPISADTGDWKRSIWFLLLLGLPVALGFGALFAWGSAAVLTAVVVIITILLVGFLLPRLNRW